MIDEISFDTGSAFGMFDWNVDDISEDSKKYFFDKMTKKGIFTAEQVYGQYCEVGFSQKAAIALTDRTYFPDPHKTGHGDYLRNVIGDELFQKEQEERRSKTNSTAMKAFAALTESKTSSVKLNRHNYMQSSNGGDIGPYMLGIGEMVFGVGLMLAGVAVEIGSFGMLTVGVAFEEAAAMALVADGFTRTMRNRDISFDRSIHLSPSSWKSTDVDTFNYPLYKKREVDSSLPTNPNDLLKLPEWTETSHPEARENGHRTFENEKTGEKLRYDQGKPWETGHKAQDHWHRHNPNSTGDVDKYLDAKGNPVPNGHPDSHLYPW